MEASWARLMRHGAPLQNLTKKLDELDDKFDAMGVDANRNRLEDGEGSRDDAQGQSIIQPVPTNKRKNQNSLWESDDNDKAYADYFNYHASSSNGDRFNQNQGYAGIFNQNQRLWWKSRLCQ